MSPPRILIFLPKFRIDYLQIRLQIYNFIFDFQ